MAADRNDNGSTGRDEEFVIRSTVRAGLKRELAFALRSQAEILSPSSSSSSSLNRLRTRRSATNTAPIITAATRQTSKKRKSANGSLAIPSSPPGFGNEPKFCKSSGVDESGKSVTPIFVDNGGGVKTEESAAPPKRNMELKMSKKIAPKKVPADVEELLETGILKGLRVSYRDPEGEQTGIKGVIKDDGILCYCSSCKGSKVISAYEFEQHAGSCRKTPSAYTYLENGKSLHDILKACENSSLDMLEDTITRAISLKQFERSYRSATVSVTSLETSSYSHNGHSQSAPLRKKSSCTRLTTKDLGLHKLVFSSGILEEGAAISYFVRGQKLLEGYIKDSGIFCFCCNSVVSPSQFEAHAGQERRKKPYNYIYLSNGMCLHELAIKLSKERNMLMEETDDVCSICQDGGDLLVCDICPRVYHLECLGLSSIPEGDWCCESCHKMHEREKFVEHNDNAIAAGRVAGVDPMEQIHRRLIRVVTNKEVDAISCEICRRPEFDKNVFSDLTVIICDQCDKEFHVGCLRDHKIDYLEELPKGTWFCSYGCSIIHSTFQELVRREKIQVPGLLIDNIQRRYQEKGLLMRASEDISWRILSGRTYVTDTETLLDQAISVLHESFDPIIDSKTKKDLIPSMVFGKGADDHYCSGMFCAVLVLGSSVVSTAILRIWGCELAELPLVATSKERQGLGYFQLLFSCIERLLASLNVRHIVLPAAEEAESIWTKKFGFTKMTLDKLKKFSRGDRIVNFEQTPVLIKPITTAMTS